MWAYEKLVWRVAWRAYRHRLAESRRHVIWFILQTTALFAILYFQPWLGNLEGEAKLAAAFVGAVFLSSILLFLWDLLRAPALLDSDRKKQLWTLRSYMRLEEDSETVMEEGIGIYEEGMQLYPDQVQRLPQEIEAWEGRASGFVRQHYDTRTYMSYLYGVGYHSGNLPETRNAKFYRDRLDRFHTILLTYSTVEQRRLDDLQRALRLEGSKVAAALEDQNG